MAATHPQSLTGTFSIKFPNGVTYHYGPDGQHIGTGQWVSADEVISLVTLRRMLDGAELANAVDTALQMDLPAEVVEVLRPALDRWDGEEK